MEIKELASKQADYWSSWIAKQSGECITVYLCRDYCEGMIELFREIAALDRGPNDEVQ